MNRSLGLISLDPYNTRGSFEQMPGFGSIIFVVRSEPYLVWLYGYLTLNKLTPCIQVTCFLSAMIMTTVNLISSSYSFTES